MKKHFLTSFLLFCCVGMLSACGSKKPKADTGNPTEAIEESESVSELQNEIEEASEEHLLYTPDASFFEGYEEGDYALYEDSAQAAEHLGDKIWIEGAITIVDSADNNFGVPGKYLLLAILQDEAGNQWTAIMGSSNETATPMRRNYDYENYGIFLEGVYFGTIEDHIPLIIANRYFQVSDGSITESNVFADFEVKAEAKEEKQSEEPKISKEFKKVMDEYEEFFDSYIDFMENYDASDTKMMMKYLSFMSEYLDTMSALQDMDQSEMNTAELKYYTETMLRIQKKLADASLSM